MTFKGNQISGKTGHAYNKMPKIVTKAD